MGKNMNDNCVLMLGAAGEKDIVVVARKYLFSGEYWSGVRETSEGEISELLVKHAEYFERSEQLEKDESLKQIIPYFVVRNRKDEYLTACRSTKSSEKRLHGERLLGFGGHLRAEDVAGKPMREWVKRELEEELYLEKTVNLNFLGLVNDDTEENGGVSKVHLGLVYVADVEGAIEIVEKESFDRGEMMDIQKLYSVRNEMGGWARILTEYLWKKQ